MPDILRIVVQVHRRAEYARFTDGADCVVQAGRLKPDSTFSDDLSSIIQAFPPIANPP